jgi:UDP-N-acetylmuramate--alanine ligase
MIIKGKKISSAYLIGVKGVGMTMLAQFLVEKGVNVRGSDISDTFMTDKVLKKEKIKVFSPFAVKNISSSSSSLVIYSSAFNKENNVEVKYVLDNKKKYPLVLLYAEALGEIFNKYFGIAVCGSHGKTTTSAWLGYVLQKGGMKPNVLTGARVPQFSGSSLVGKGKYFVCETDEYQNKLKYFSPQGVVLNNIDYDHPDFFKTEASYLKVFAEFVGKIPNVSAKGFLVANFDDAKVKKVSRFCRGKVLSYSLLDASAMYYAKNISSASGKQNFSVYSKKKLLGNFQISLSGKHNISNALAVIATSLELGLKVGVVKKYLASFLGTERRMQVLGKYHGATIIDDYAHHPTEIVATLAGAREMYGQKKRIITVFHPHTFTRTKKFLLEFSKSFSLSDELIVLDIYGSAREKQGGVSSADLVKLVKKYSPQVVSKNISGISAVAKYLSTKKLNENDIILLMGAGDVFRVGSELLKKK